MGARVTFVVGPLGITTSRPTRGAGWLKGYKYTKERGARLWAIAQGHDHSDGVTDPYWGVYKFFFSGGG